MIKQSGTKIYYCLFTGNVLQIVRAMEGYITETTFEQDYEIYTELKERDKESIGILNFEYGKYSELSEGSTGVMVNLETKELIFSYEELPIPPQEPTEIEIIKSKISILSEKVDAQTVEITGVQNGQTKQDIDVKDNMYACVELCDMVLGMMDQINQVPQVQALNINLKGVESGMAKIYAKLIIEGDMTIEQVPNRYKAEVERLLTIMDK